MLFKEMERGERAMIDDDSLNYSGSRKRTMDGRERDQGRRERESILAAGNRAEASVAAAPKTAVLFITSWSTLDTRTVVTKWYQAN